MARRKDAGNTRKRQRTRPAEPANHRRPRFTREQKGKYVLREEALLVIKLQSAHDIDRDFRSITHNRFYWVQGWINPGEEYRTQTIRPDFQKMKLDPDWDEFFCMPLGDTSLENATLHLDVLRISLTPQDPGTSSLAKLVGRVEFRLDKLQPDRVIERSLALMQPAEIGWKPEGYIVLAMKLKLVPT